MNERRSHPTTERLEAFVEASLERAERAVVDAHVASCARCRTEVGELGALFEALGGLPAVEPPDGFADRVMARVRVRVRVRRPALATAAAWLERVTPQSTRGWAAAAAVLALPVIGATVLVAWLLSQPGVSAQGLWMFTTGQLMDAAAVSWQWAATQLAGSVLAVWAAEAAAFLGSVGTGQVGLAVVLFTTLTAGSVYILYQNLFREHQQRRIEHASYVF